MRVIYHRLTSALDKRRVGRTYGIGTVAKKKKEKRAELATAQIPAKPAKLPRASLKLSNRGKDSRHAHGEKSNHAIIVERLQDEPTEKRVVDAGIFVVAKVGKVMLANVHHSGDCVRRLCLNAYARGLLGPRRTRGFRGFGRGLDARVRCGFRDEWANGASDDGRESRVYESRERRRGRCQQINREKKGPLESKSGIRRDRRQKQNSGKIEATWSAVEIAYGVYPNRLFSI